MQTASLQFSLPFKTTFLQVLEDVQAERACEHVPSRAEPLVSVAKTVLQF